MHLTLEQERPSFREVTAHKQEYIPMTNPINGWTEGGLMAREIDLYIQQQTGGLLSIQQAAM